MSLIEKEESSDKKTTIQKKECTYEHQYVCPYCGLVLSCSTKSDVDPKALEIYCPNCKKIVTAKIVCSVKEVPEPLYSPENPYTPCK